MKLTSMKQVKDFAEHQTDIYNEVGSSDDLIGFNFEGTFIINPFTTEDCMEEVNPIKYYGKQNYDNFVKQINNLNIK